ncbi:MAG TPA: hypothetical protein VHC67_00750 [Gaiellaceae bacterium]|jgi:hypothetical protein|nr:hypothetical protein [Gaiellaceae bacterium]
MKRLALIGLLLATFWPTAANAAVPCRNRIYNDWYGDGKIATDYPISCYRDAIKHVSNDAKIYSSLVDDIKSAMQAAIEREHHKKVPAEVGKGNPTRTGKGTTTKAPTTTGPSTPTSQTTSVAIGPASSNTNGGGGGGIPTPIIILGALAILLAAAGAGGTWYRRRKAPPAV